MITQREVSKKAFREKVSDKVIEKDYVLTWLLLALADSPLRDLVGFKGGTALKKSYFPDYRYSEDLDFTVVRDADSAAILRVLSETLTDLARSQGFQFDLPEGRVEKRADSLTAYVSFVGPLQAGMGSRDVKVDFTLTEQLVYPIEPRLIMSDYSDAVVRKLSTYSLEEVLVEKLCALIGRTEPRDVYDAHFLLERCDLDLEGVAHAFETKAASKKVDPDRLKEVLDRKQRTLAKMWETRLRHQVRGLPHFEEVVRELSRKLRRYRLV